MNVSFQLELNFSSRQAFVDRRASQNISDMSAEPFGFKQCGNTDVTSGDLPAGINQSPFEQKRFNYFTLQHEARLTLNLINALFPFN
jgi:hypothetical protein